MKTSARNQFMGTVSGYKAGAVNDEVELTLAGGHRVVAIVTRESTELLELQARLGIPMVLISHDEEDVRRFGDEVVRVRAGQVKESDEPEPELA